MVVVNGMIKKISCTKIRLCFLIYQKFLNQAVIDIGCNIIFIYSRFIFRILGSFIGIFLGTLFSGILERIQTLLN